MLTVGSLAQVVELAQWRLRRTASMKSGGDVLAPGHLLQVQRHPERHVSRADVKIMLLGGVFYNAMSRAILPVQAPAALYAFAGRVCAHAMRVHACPYDLLCVGFRT